MAAAGASGSDGPRLYFTADSVNVFNNNDSFEYQVKFWKRPNGHLAVRWAPPPRTDGVVLAGVQRERVLNIVAVAFYPVKLQLNSQSVYVMSVWRRDEQNTRRLVDTDYLYRGRNYNGNNSRADEDPGQLFPVDATNRQGHLFPVDETNRDVFNCLRFSQEQIDASLTRNCWGQFGWNVARRRRIGGDDDAFYIVASEPSIVHPLETLRGQPSVNADAYTVSLRALRSQAPGGGGEQAICRVDFQDLDGEPPRPGHRGQLRVTVRDAARDNGNNLVQVTHVSRVQFVHDGNGASYLRLYQNALGPETLVDNHDWFLGEEVAGEGARRISSAIARARQGMLIFDAGEVWTNRNMWRTNLGWHLQSMMNPLLLQAEPRPPLPAFPPPLQAPAPARPETDEYDISGLLAAVAISENHRGDVQRLNGWQCAICCDGIGEGRELAAAHDAYEDASENHVLHVFHKHCLRKWQNSRQDCCRLCPTCKVPLNTSPLPGVWHPGKTTLGRMGVNPYMVKEALAKIPG